MRGEPIIATVRRRITEGTDPRSSTLWRPINTATTDLGIAGDLMLSALTDLLPEDKRAFSEVWRCIDGRLAVIPIDAEHGDTYAMQDVMTVDDWR